MKRILLISIGLFTMNGMGTTSRWTTAGYQPGLGKGVITLQSEKLTEGSQIELALDMNNCSIDEFGRDSSCTKRFDAPIKGVLHLQDEDTFLRRNLPAKLWMVQEDGAPVSLLRLVEHKIDNKPYLKILLLEEDKTTVKSIHLLLPLN